MVDSACSADSRERTALPKLYTSNLPRGTRLPRVALKPAVNASALTSIPVLVTAALSSLLAVVFARYAFDDPFITYRYTANVLGGQGFVYNAGSRVLSTTTPLYALLLVLPGAAGISIPLASNLIGCASIGLGALGLWRLGNLWGTAGAGWIAL